MDTYETKIYTGVVITSVALGIIILFFVWAITRSQRHYYLKRKEQIMNEVGLLEEERKRIAQDLHDDLGPELAMTRLQLQRLALQSPCDLKERLMEAETRMEDIIQRMKAIARNLTPRHILQRGLPAMLEDYAARWEDLYQVKFIMSYEVASKLQEEMSLQLFRLVQELVHNCIKHSEATVITLQLQELKGQVYLFFSDNGKGFEPSTEPRGLGLKGLQERTQLLGGSLHCESQPGSGTQYLFTLPLKFHQ